MRSVRCDLLRSQVARPSRRDRLPACHRRDLLQARAALVGGFQIPNIDYAVALFPTSTVNSGAASFAEVYQGMVYMPSMLEVGVAVGVVALGALMLCLGLKYLPLRPAEHEE